MRTLLALCSICFASWAIACGNDLDGETLIGSTCKTEDDCDVAGVCVTSGEDGLCSAKCRFPGAAQECPLGSYCDERQVETSEDAEAAMILCFPACNEQRDCRAGYNCRPVTEGEGKVCVP